MRMKKATRDRIVQVRLDPTLKQQLEEHLKRLRARDPKATESLAVRTLLRAALAGAGAVPLPMADAGYQEGMRRGYDEVRRAITAAVSSLFRKEGTR